jgi:hypothetical protein
MYLKIIITTSFNSEIFKSQETGLLRNAYGRGKICTFFQFMQPAGFFKKASNKSLAQEKH